MADAPAHAVPLSTGRPRRYKWMAEPHSHLAGAERTVNPSVAVVGATGAVGVLMRQVLEERAFPVKAIKFLASPKSAGKSVSFRGRDYQVEPLRAEAFAGVDIVLSSTPASVSRE